MIICMIVLLELWTRVHSQSLHHRLTVNFNGMSGSREQLTDDMTTSSDTKVSDLEIFYFWKWTK